MAELEQKWQNEVDEAQQGKLENNTPFFHDYHFFEVRQEKHVHVCYFWNYCFYQFALFSVKISIYLVNSCTFFHCSIH